MKKSTLKSSDWDTLTPSGNKPRGVQWENSKERIPESEYSSHRHTGLYIVVCNGKKQIAHWQDRDQVWRFIGCKETFPRSYPDQVLNEISLEPWNTSPKKVSQ